MRQSTLPHLQSTDAGLRMDGVSLIEVAREFGSPTYVYSHAAMAARWQAFERAFGDRKHLVCYAVKACSNIAVLNSFARLGSGFDIVSGGELERVLLAGGEASRVVFSGVGKRYDEIRRALEVDIRCFNVESLSELKAIEHCARELRKVAPVSLRINPDVESGTHAHIATGMKNNKFGLAAETAMELCQRAAKSDFLEVTGISCHIGSQITVLEPFATAFARMLQFAHAVEALGIKLRQIDFGGGLGVAYDGGKVPGADAYVACLLEKLDEHCRQGCPWTILIEPGRALIADAGLLLTRVIYLKTESPRNFVVVDVAMNDLLRPALYAARHRVVSAEADTRNIPTTNYDVVGPVCESADVIAGNCNLAIAEGDLLAVLSTGAYGFSMASNYNSRQRPAEVLIRNGEALLIRERESFEALVAGETIA